MSIQNELTKLYKKLSEEGLNKEAQRLTPFIKEARFGTMLNSSQRQGLRELNRMLRKKQFSQAAQTLRDMGITDASFLTAIEGMSNNKMPRQKRIQIMKQIKAAVKLMSLGKTSITMSEIKQEADKDASAAPEIPGESTPDAPSGEAPKTPESPSSVKAPQAPEGKTETDESKTGTPSTSSKPPATEDEAIGDDNYKYFYNAEKKGFQVAKGSKNSAGAILRAKNNVSGRSDDYNSRLDNAYAIVYKMFVDKGYDMRGIDTPTDEAKYKGSASAVRYDAWNPADVGLDALDSTVDVGSVKYSYYTLGSTNVTNKDLDNYSSSKTYPLIAIKKSDLEGSRKTKVKDYFNPVEGSPDALTPAEVTITPASPGGAETYVWKKKA